MTYDPFCALALLLEQEGAQTPDLTPISFYAASNSRNGVPLLEAKVDALDSITLASRRVAHV
tara:strand:- start:239 stop:424 length:186 start_codon:yes stop_codon:yes gene_type:complete